MVEVIFCCCSCGGGGVVCCVECGLIKIEIVKYIECNILLFEIFIEEVFEIIEINVEIIF